MRKILFLVLCIFSAMTIYSQVSKGSISVLLPNGWVKVDGSILEHQYLKNGASFMIKEESALNGKNLIDAVPIAKKKIADYFNDYALIKEERILVDNKSGVSIVFSYSVKIGGSTVKMQMQTIYIIINNKCQTISFGAMAKEFNVLSDDINMILKNIRFK